MRKELRWKVENGVVVLVGTDPLVGLYKSFTLSQNLLVYLHDYCLNTLRQFRVVSDTPTVGSYWLTASDLELTNIWDEEWDNYVVVLVATGIKIRDEPGYLVWS